MWRPPAFATQFCTRGAVSADFSIFYKTPQKVAEMVQVTDLFHTFPPLMFFFVGLTKTETAAKTAPRVPKLGYKVLSVDFMSICIFCV